MGLAKVKFSSEVFTAFFEETGKAFSVTKGLPKGSKLVKIQHRDGVHEAIFQHESFGSMEKIAEINVQFTAFEMVSEPSIPLQLHPKPEEARQ